MGGDPLFHRESKATLSALSRKVPGLITGNSFPKNTSNKSVDHC